MSKRNHIRKRTYLGPWWVWTTAAGAIIGLALAASCTPAHADPIDDVAFLQTLDGQGIHYSSATFAIGVGHAVCNDLAAGYSVAAETGRLWLLSDLDRYDAGYYVGAAEAAYCPGPASTPAPGSGREAV